MRHRAACTVLSLVLLSSAMAADQAPGEPHFGRETWYEVLLKKMDPSHMNYGEWLEGRRQIVLDASVRNPFFWYSFWMTVCASLVLLAFLKYARDSHEASWEHARIEADLRNHDLHSRQRAREAIEKYNKHIEECNRATEASESGEGRPGWGRSEVGSMKAELQRVVAQLEATTQDRNKLQEELRQKSLVVADLSFRLDALSKKVNGSGHTTGPPDEPRSEKADRDETRLVGHINRMQEELYAERQKNKRLKGS